MSSGRVTLVGAGPGDPDLITVAGLSALSGADVVVHDRLVSRELLAHAPPRAEIIDAGKSPAGSGSRGMAQEQINALLIERAQRGLQVVRLKGGDPFVFGRGGEEADALRDADVPFEVIPGISSATAAAALAGIPVTDRRHRLELHRGDRPGGGQRRPADRLAGDRADRRDDRGADGLARAARDQRAPD